MLRYRLYVIEEGNEAEPDFRLIEEIEATTADAVATIEDRFRTLLLNDPRIGNVFVFSSAGTPPGSIVAAELVSPLPSHPRQLRWVADKATGLRVP